jgi:hypothetical protein
VEQVKVKEEVQEFGRELSTSNSGTGRAAKIDMQATFFQKVILCAIAAFFAAALIQWGKVFVTGADDALNKGYQHRTSLGSGGNP